MKILVLDGPNINMLGIREPQIYGKESYEALKTLLARRASELDIDLTHYQSNHEGCLVDRIQQAYFDRVDGIIINPGAYTHTSIAILDALKAISIPCVEVHISKVDMRESYRLVSYVREVAVNTISGKGIYGYVEALEYLKDYLESNEG